MAEYKIAVIGNKTDVLGFIAIGFDAYPTDSKEEAEILLDRLVKEEKHAVIFIIDALAQEIEEAVAKYKYSAIPAIIAIPGAKGTTGYGQKQIKESVEKAVGADILFKDN